MRNGLTSPDIESTTLSDLIRSNVSDPYLVSDDAFRLSFDRELAGDSRSNTLFGSAKADLIDGKSRGDTIDGRGGNDILSGGRGRDTFLFGGDLIDGLRDVDTISDFESIDTLDLSGYLGAGGTVSFQQFSQTQLLVDLSGEDSLNIVGNRRGIAAAIDQLTVIAAAL